MRRKEHYKFTNKKYALKGIMAVNLGAISIAFLVLAIIFACRDGGVAAFNYGITGLLGTLFSVTGLVLALMARFEKDKYYLFANIGIGLNGLYILLMSALIIWGAQ